MYFRRSRRLAGLACLPDLGQVRVGPTHSAGRIRLVGRIAHEVEPGGLIDRVAVKDHVLAAPTDVDDVPGGGRVLVTVDLNGSGPRPNVENTDLPALRKVVCINPEVVRDMPDIVGVWTNYKTYLDRPSYLNKWHRQVPAFFMLDDHEILNDINGAGTPVRAPK